MNKSGNLALNVRYYYHRLRFYQPLRQILNLLQMSFLLITPLNISVAMKFEILTDHLYLLSPY